MKNQLFEFFKRKEVIFLWILFIVLAPMLFFGHPGFYGDDIHFAQTIEQSGMWEGIKAWAHNYGLFYRPLGVTFLYIVYGFIGQYAGLLYGFSLFLYFSFCYVLYRELNLITADLLLSSFVTFFVACFPLGPTAFLQLSSLYQILTAMFVVLLVGTFYRKYQNFDLKKMMLFSFFWFLLLLTYEQVTGLVAVLGLLILLSNISKDKKTIIKQISQWGSLLGITTMLFVVVYVFTPGNPKMVTLVKLNQKESINTEVVQSKTNSSETLVKTNIETVTEEPKIIKPHGGRLNALLMKFNKVAGFFTTNFVYAMQNLITQGWKGLFIICAVLFLIFPLMLLPTHRTSKLCSLSYALVGLVWFTSTISPFFLYKAIHLPPYVLVIPSVGLALLIKGFYELMWPVTSKLSPIIFKCCFIFVVLLFPFQQYGYYFGLKEELQYWRQVANQLEPHKSELLAGEQVKLENILPKNNQHIFWLEDAIGKRYFKVLLGEEFINITSEYDTEKQTMTFLLAKAEL